MHGDIVIAEMEGEFTVKRLLPTPRPVLQPMNPAYPAPFTLTRRRCRFLVW